MDEHVRYSVDYPLQPEAQKSYLCACIDHRFFEAVLEEFRKLTGLHMVYLETEMGGAPAFGSKPKSAELAYDELRIRKMGWAAHGDNCAGFPGRPNEEMLAKLRTVALERKRDFPEAEHYVLFATLHPPNSVHIEVEQL